MLRKNTKLFLSKRFAGCNVDLNVKSSVILSEILAEHFALEIQNSSDIQFSNVLYLTDTNTMNDSVDLELEDWIHTNQYSYLESMTFPKRIDTWNAYIFADPDLPLKKIRKKYNFVILGPINNIPEAIFDRICATFSDRYLVFYGDSLVNANEHQNYHLRYLSNSTFALSLNYDTARLSPRKKINGLLHKLRRERTRIEDIITSPWVSVDYADNISSSIILQHLEEHPENTCILPLRLFSKLTSECFCLKYGDDIRLLEGRTYYLKEHWIYQDAKGHTRVLDPMTPIQIGDITKEFRHPVNGRHFMLAHMILSSDTTDGAPFTVLKDCAIDVSEYVTNFNYEDHPSNLEEFQILHENYWGVEDVDHTVLKLLPFRMAVGEKVKSFYSHETLCFIESLERNLLYKTDRNWFKYFVRTKEKVSIVHCDEFQNK